MRWREALQRTHRTGAIGPRVDNPSRRDAADAENTVVDDSSAPVEPPERIITLTDGVIAIAMTLLVLDLSATIKAVRPAACGRR